MSVNCFCAMWKRSNFNYLVLIFWLMRILEHGCWKSIIIPTWVSLINLSNKCSPKWLTKWWRLCLILSSLLLTMNQFNIRNINCYTNRLVFIELTPFEVGQLTTNEKTIIHYNNFLPPIVGIWLRRRVGETVMQSVVLGHSKILKKIWKLGIQLQ